ncbi:amidohydrolase family protein [Anaerotruncus massiliensis (ex Togo et al. 2019)]|uniref:amidohydrolase family protein n=1 Tax=Anaerotruncus massiliensis (ex Togo et al. 2019) TaxID=1673720 RepID=UPI0027BA0C6D|nr:amidohydrolase family protein [Anaerotruncus massiliensis (ex Togo et al. 2019)]
MLEKTTFALRGHILHTPTPRAIVCMPESYLVCEEGKTAGVFTELPERFKGIPVEDCGDRLVIPGLVDLHLHAPQYSFRALGMDLELLDWLNTHTFPEEAKYADPAYAGRAYRIFADDLAASPTTRAAVFGTIHRPATELLMDLIEETGVRALVGKVNMDRNSPDILREESAAASLEDTARWISETKGKYRNVAPILTPRFTPSCTDELMEGLGKLQRETGLPVQSHLSENFSEIAWVKELCPWSGCYGGAYDRFGLFGGDAPTIMAHCVHSTGEEIDLMQARGVFIAHCAQSNTNLASGVAPVRAYLDRGMKVGLGTDIAGGFSLSVFHAMADAVQASKLRWRLLDDSLRPLTVPEAFYLGTKGGGEFFGKVGSFEEGYEFDAVVLDDSGFPHPQALTPVERLERILYLDDGRCVRGKYVAGARVR